MIDEIVRKIYDLLVNKKYQEIEIETNGARLQYAEINGAIEDYGKTLKAYPPDVEFDVIKIEDRELENKWSVVAPVYTVEENLSDLSIELTITHDQFGKFLVELDDIHVL